MAIIKRNKIRFIFNDDIITLDVPEAEDTLLKFLQLTSHKTNKKNIHCETYIVLVGRLYNNKLFYESIDSSEQLLIALNGTHVISIEHIESHGGIPALLSQAMMSNGGKECDICASNVLMPLYGLWMQKTGCTIDDIERVLRGNSSDCANHISIMRAALAMKCHEDQAFQSLIIQKDKTTHQLQALTDGVRIEINGCNNNRVIFPEDLNDLAHIIQTYPEATIIAGPSSTNMQNAKTGRIKKPMIFTAHLNELHTANHCDNKLLLGAGLTYNQAATALRQTVPSLSTLWGHLGNEQVRNMERLGDNLIKGPFANVTLPALMALSAQLVMQSGETEQNVFLEDYYLDGTQGDSKPDGFIRAIELPSLCSNEAFHVYKTSKSNATQGSVCGAFFVRFTAAGRIDKVRIVFSGMTPQPKRALAAENVLRGRLWDESNLEQALQAFDQDYNSLSDWRTSSRYQMIVARHLLRRFFLETSTGIPTSAQLHFSQEKHVISGNAFKNSVSHQMH